MHSTSTGGIDYVEILIESDPIKTLPEMFQVCQEIEKESRNDTMGMIDNDILPKEGGVAYLIIVRFQVQK